MIRHRNHLMLLALAISSIASFAHADAPPESYELVEGKIRFVCEGPEVTVPAWGQFGTVEGALSVDPLDLRKASGNIDVYMVSVRTDDAAWDTMFRRAGFLEIDDHPKSRFVVEEVRGAKRLKRGAWVPVTLEGRFMLHGIIRKVSVPATVKWVPADSKSEEDSRIRVRASFHITWDEYQIAVPTGRTRNFTGDGALIQADLQYSPKKVKIARGKRSK
ncbi:MAG: YceI family protein [Myxococcales bacterium]|nr:YceI family protein [Myxococcales bacterium]MDH3845789.1 YceI family protein [Myxococcales bacterium]